LRTTADKVSVLVLSRWWKSVPENPAPFTFTEATRSPSDHSTQITFFDGPMMMKAWTCIVGLGATPAVTGTFTWTVSSMNVTIDDAFGQVYALRGTLHAVCPGPSGEVTVDVTW